jgi:hypothetical protein
VRRGLSVTGCEAPKNTVRRRPPRNNHKTGTWASRKVGDFLDTLKHVSHGLKRKQVEALFAKRRYNP